MPILNSDAVTHLEDLVARAEAGDQVVLMRQGRAVAQLAALELVPLDRAARRALLEAARAQGRATASHGEGAARSQDFLYLGDGTPG